MNKADELSAEDIARLADFFEVLIKIQNEQDA